ncbi:MAG: tetratricopeptide repeat protein [Pseudomonadota bacterium]
MTGAVESSRPSALQRLLPAIDQGPRRPVRSVADADRLFHIDADFARDGAWSGVRRLVAEAFVELHERGHADLVERHHYELHRVLPEYRDRIALRNACLTDTAHGSERTRNFPLDRAYRLVHGLVGMLLEWKRLLGAGQRWLVVVDNTDRAQHLAQRFIVELARRGAREDAFEVLIDTGLDPAAFAARTPGMRIESAGVGLEALGLSPLPAPTLDEASREALERRLQGNDILDWEEHYPPLLAYHLARGDGAKSAAIALRALCICNHYGYYHESASFADTLLPYFDEIVGDDENARWNYIGNVFQGLVTTGAEDRALELVLTLAEPRIARPDLRARMHYLLSMGYLRYTRSPNLAKAEAHIFAAADAIQAARGALAPEDFHFLKVFIDNGLAFLRVRQGRQAEALSLCQSGYALLTNELGEERHMLHRSVLQYNTAQVYVMLGRSEEAMEHYRKSIEMDPYYSEYYNEVGNILQREDRFEEAMAMYERAIEYSAPYPEVHFNRGVCLIGLGRHEEAMVCFDTSLELNPAQPDLYLVRAEVHEAEERIDEALADYDAAIALAPDLVPARVNRAVLHYGAGRYAEALADMDHVVALAPGEADHYLNRAEIHKAMAQRELYQRDLAAAEACAAAA